MKRVLLGLGILVIFLGLGELKAQTPQKKASKNVIKVNYLSAVGSTVNGFYERMITDRWSVQLGAAYYFPRWLSFSSSMIDKGHRLTVEARYYPIKEHKVVKGWYVGPFFRYRYLEVDWHGKITTYNGGMLVGFHRVYNQRISLDYFIGPFLASHQVENWMPTHGPFDYSYGLVRPIGIRAGATFGIAF